MPADRQLATLGCGVAAIILGATTPRVAALVKGAADRGIYIRDRSAEAGCAGCVRIATGAVAHTQRCIEVMREVL